MVRIVTANWQSVNAPKRQQVGVVRRNVLEQVGKSLPRTSWLSSVTVPHILDLFFFSSRRRHTRCSRDWSSDVCSSDLPPSDVPEDPKAYSQDRAVEDLRGLLDALSIKKAHVCGLSKGGYATLHFALRYPRSEEHTSELQSRLHLVCRLLLEKKQNY